jgi:hypothetical protein
MVRFKAYLQTYKKEIIFLLFLAFIAALIAGVHFSNIVIERERKERDKVFYQNKGISEISEEAYTYESTKESYSKLYSMLGQLVVGITDSYFDGTTSADKAADDIEFYLKYYISNIKATTQIDLDIYSTCLNVFQLLYRYI